MSTASRNSNDVAIVGGGIGGLTLALALSQRGIGCRVFEQTPDFAEEGVGLQLSPNATRLLDALGLGEAVRAVSVRPEAIELLDWAGGRRIFRVPLGQSCEHRFGAPLLTVRRKALHAALVGAIPEKSVVMGARLEALDTSHDHVTLRFADGTAHTAGVVVGADGLHSVVRHLLAGDALQYSGKAVYRGICASPADGIRVWTGPGQHCVAYPVTADGTVSFTAVVAGAKELRASYNGWTPELHKMFDAAQSLRRWELHDRPSTRTWVSTRVALLGDAAHAMLPFLAQGANAAIEDAYVLAGCLAPSWPHEVTPALQRYQALRVPRATKLQAEARARGQHAKPRQAATTATYLDKQEWIFAYDATSSVNQPEGASR
jgi:salicylate hydroxylase